jgi:hypothetical protein
LLLRRILPVFSIVAPCHTGASLVSVRRGLSPRAAKTPQFKAWVQIIVVLQVGVTEQFLRGPDVVPVVDEMGGERVGCSSEPRGGSQGS